ncbi:MAG: protein YgfX [Sideroxyarcus sp.]|jgi:toxin CptA
MGMQLNYKLRPSRSLALLFFLLCVLLLVSIWMLPLPVAGLLALTVGVLCWTGYYLLRDATLRMGHSCVAFRLEGQEEIVLVLRSGRHLPGRVAMDSLVTPALVILNVALKEQSGRRSLLILPDTMGAESFRRLRVALKWGDKADQVAT